MQEIALAFPDMEGAFNSTSFEVAAHQGIGCIICWCVGSVLGSRKVTAKLAGETLQECCEGLPTEGRSIASTGRSHLSDFFWRNFALI
jgi:hypothetical protein